MRIATRVGSIILLVSGVWPGVLAYSIGLPKDIFWDAFSEANRNRTHGL